MKTSRFTNTRPPSPTRGLRVRGTHLIVLGAGGNIGSHLVPLLARLGGVGSLTLVDHDRYEEKNLQSQAINPAEVGQNKARVQARRARQANPKLAVVAIADRLENVPLGCLRGDVILAGVDSKESRRCANEIAWRLGVPWIDAGVEPSLMLARVNVYLPGVDQPCLECAWGERDYAELATVHPCDGGATETPASNSPACLGALAAALAAIECQKLIAGQSAAALIGRQVMIEAASHRHFVTSFRRNHKCRFDHAIWKIYPLRRTPRELFLGAVLKPSGHTEAATVLGFGDQPVVKQLDCPACGFSRRVFQLQRRLRCVERLCERCGREMLSAGFHMKTRLSRADLGPGDADRSLASLGFRAGDVISLGDGAKEKFFELAGDSSPRPGRAKTINRRSP